MSDSKLKEIKLTFVRVDSRGYKHTVSASIDVEEGGWQQWGAPQPVLGDNVALLEAMARGAIESGELHGEDEGEPEDEEQEDDEDEEEDSE